MNEDAGSRGSKARVTGNMQNSRNKMSLEAKRRGGHTTDPVNPDRQSPAKQKEQSS